MRLSNEVYQIALTLAGASIQRCLSTGVDAGRCVHPAMCINCSADAGTVPLWEKKADEVWRREILKLPESAGQELRICVNTY